MPVADLEQLRIKRDAGGAFARLAAETWLRVTDDYAVPEELGDLPEVFFRIGFLSALQLAGQGGADEATSEAVAMLGVGSARNDG